ncbi:MAG: ribosome rescue protein RqcH [Candidatus Ranarchaeia archaeon]
MPIPTKKSLTNVDIAAIVHELKLNLVGGRINNIYQLEKNLFIFKIHVPSETIQLILELGVRFHLTNYQYQIPTRPSNKAMVLRSHIRGSRIKRISQHNFDRVVIMDLERSEEKTRVVIELFGKGNLTLIKENDLIKYSTTYIKMKDRNILANKPYHFPPSRKVDILNLEIEKFIELIASQKESKPIQGFLVENLGLNPKYCEEICYLSEIDPKMPIDSLSSSDQKKLFKSFDVLMSKIKNDDFQPTMYIIDNNIVESSPFLLSTFKNEADLEIKESNSYNEIVDDLFATKESMKMEKVDKTQTKDSSKKIEKKKKRTLEKQKRALEELREKSIKFKFFGDLLFQNLYVIDELVNTILNARKNGKSWEEITTKISLAKEKKIEGINFFHDIDLKNGILTVKINEKEIPLDMRKTVTESAQEFYQKSKKAVMKVKGAELAVKKQIEKAEKIKIEITEEKTLPIMYRKQKKNWYEKFRWFVSKNGFLVVAGRDQKTNELLVSKYLEKEDIFIHAEIQGAPATIIKKESKKIDKETIKQASSFAASFSNAWKTSVGSIDVFYVSGDQVSKTPPSGQYVPKGSFIISGKRNFIKDNILKLAIGYIQSHPLKEPVEPEEVISKSESEQRILGKYIIGPKEAITKQTDLFVEIIPGRLKTTDLSKKVRNEFRLRLSDKEKHALDQINLDDLIRILPSSGGEIKV